MQRPLAQQRQAQPSREPAGQHARYSGQTSFSRQKGPVLPSAVAHKETEAASTSNSECPFKGARLFTRLTDTEPPRCPMAGDRVFSTVEPEYMPFTPDEDWMEIDQHYDEEIEEKRQMLRMKPTETFSVLPEGLDCCQELLDMLGEYLPQRYPDRFHMQGTRLSNRVTGEVFDVAGDSMHPLEAASLLVQEDLCLLKNDAKGRMRLVAGSVAFPMRWALLQKMGRPMHLIHAPVPFYQKDLRKPVDEFMAGLTAEQTFWRANYGVTDHPFLYQLFSEAEVVAAVKGKRESEGLQELSVHDAGDRLYLRNERQTLRRLPKTGAVLFTIRTYVRHLREIADRPDLCSRLANALTVTPDEFVNYKTMTALKQVTLDWLDLQHSRHRRMQQPLATG